MHFTGIKIHRFCCIRDYGKEWSLEHEEKLSTVSYCSRYGCRKQANPKSYKYIYFYFAYISKCTLKELNKDYYGTLKLAKIKIISIALKWMYTMDRT